MFVKSIFMCLLALSLFYTTTGSRSLKLLGGTSEDINDIIQDFLGGDSSPSSPSTGVESPFLDILRISTGGGDSDDDGNPFQDFFGRIQDLADGFSARKHLLRKRHQSQRLAKRSWILIDDTYRVIVTLTKQIKYE
eukprot:TRINITY_DN1675_c0_g1_i7.p2 TRINITY_DN1675_c0_g1~~TRINITY_DN1675_c0_g1_i7.p2  ORF type:complete len:136 (+),score=7.23 TRINITY_DN1675_c0_g1_i7:147-554(+)